MIPVTPSLKQTGAKCTTPASFYLLLVVMALAFLELFVWLPLKLNGVIP